MTTKQDVEDFIKKQSVKMALKSDRYFNLQRYADGMYDLLKHLCEQGVLKDGPTGPTVKVLLPVVVSEDGDYQCVRKWEHPDRAVFQNMKFTIIAEVPVPESASEIKGTVDHG